jgi:hypothetical protein
MLVADRDGLVVDADNTSVGDGDAEHVAGEVGKEMLRIAVAVRACLTDESRKPCLIKCGAVTSAITNAVEHSIAAFDHDEAQTIGHQEIVLLFIKKRCWPATQIESD